MKIEGKIKIPGLLKTLEYNLEAKPSEHNDLVDRANIIYFSEDARGILVDCFYMGMYVSAVNDTLNLALASLSTQLDGLRVDYNDDLSNDWD